MQAPSWAEPMHPWDGAFIPIEHWHFHRQLFARYRIVLEPGEWSAMRRDVQAGDSLVVARRIGDREIHWVKCKGSGRGVFVGTVRGIICTAWPPTRALWRAKAEAKRRNKASEYLSQTDHGARVNAQPA